MTTEETTTEEKPGWQPLPDPPECGEVAIHLAALTRVEWSGKVRVPRADLADRHALDRLVDAVYEHVDGGEYHEDPHFWDKSQNCRYDLDTTGLSPTPVLEASYDADGDLVIRDIPVQTRMLERLAQLDQLGGPIRQASRIETTAEHGGARLWICGLMYMTTSFAERAFVFGDRDDAEAFVDEFSPEYFKPGQYRIVCEEPRPARAGHPS